MSDEQTPEPQPAQFETQSPHGALQECGSDWIRYALTTEAPSHVQGVDHGLNPSLGGHGDDGATAYA